MINVGVIGAGTWGKNHVRIFRELGNVNLVKIADLNKNNLDELHRKYSIPITQNDKDILNDNKITAVSVSTPASTHYKIVKEALLANKDVFVEKPLTLNSKEGEELTKIAEERDRILMVGHIFRFNPGVLKLKEELSKGTFGKVRFMYGARLGLMTPRQDCGVIFDFALHDIDTFCFILGDMPIEVTALKGSYLNTQFEDVGFINLRFKNNIMAHVTVSWLTPKKVRELWLVGEDKCANLDYLSQQLDIFNKGIVPKYDSFGDFELITKEGEEYRPYFQNKEPLKEELKHFIECTEKGEKPIVGGKIGVDMVKIIEACYKSAEQRRTFGIK